MPVTVIVGAQWGDEGKGKVTDFLATQADIVSRFQGGNNAGHTVIVNGVTHKLHLLPSGVVNPAVKNVLGNGLVVDPKVLLQELASLADKGLVPQLFISDRAQVILPIHRWLDGAAEDSGGGIGTTRRGIGPTYTDKVQRSGVRIGDLLDPRRLRERLHDMLPEHLLVLRHRGSHIPASDYEALAAADLSALIADPTPLVEAMAEEYLAYGAQLRERIVDTVALLHDGLNHNATIVLEGAQGTFLDIDHGTYPFVTSSNTISGGACIGAGVPPTMIDSVCGIVKAYTTRVGSGPFVTELDYDTDAGGKHLTDAGHEFGTTTGRRRRCGWLDLVLLRRAVELNGMTTIALTKLDVLGGLSEIKVCVAYELDGTRLTRMPSDAADLARCVPVYESLPGFEKLSKATVVHASEQGLSALPKAAADYVRYIEQHLEVPIELIGLGPGREETIDRRKTG